MPYKMRPTILATAPLLKKKLKKTVEDSNMIFKKEYINSKLAGFMVKNSLVYKDKLGVKLIN
jgi:hypothetical protein